jgi:FdhE protein
MKSTSAYSQVDATIELIGNRAPAYGELVGRFGPLLREKARLGEQFAAKKLIVPGIDPARVSAGVPVLAEQDISPWTEEFRESARSLLPLTAQALGMEDAVLDRFTNYFNESENILGLAQARIEGNRKLFENTSVQLSTQPDVTLYVTETVSSPVFNAIAVTMGEPFPRETWGQGHCPVCGSSPSLAMLVPGDTANAEYLVGGGGAKYLHCSLCGQDWRYRRTACAACGNEENDTREILHQDGMKFERIEACHKCGKYMLTIDLREYATPPHPEAIQMGLIHLDVIARQRQLVPVSPTLWNTID